MQELFPQSTASAYLNGHCAGLVAWSHKVEGRAEPFGRRHTTATEARQFASEAKYPVVNLAPLQKRADRAFWLGYLRSLRNGI